MAKSPHTLAREQIVQAAEKAQTDLSDHGIHLETCDIIKIAADYAAKYAVLSTQYGTSESRRELGEQLRREFITRMAHWEDIFLGGGEKMTISNDPLPTLRKIELLDMMLMPPAKRRGRPPRRP